MAVTRAKKNTLVTKLSDLFATSKGTACASYTGLSVADLQELRSLARANEVTILVTKNRLVRVALSSSDRFKDAKNSLLTGQLVYAFSSTDEIAPAQILAKFAKTHPELKLVTGFDNAGNNLDTATIIAMSTLPSKEQLRAQLLGVFTAPLRNFLQVTNGNQSGLVRVLSAHADKL